MALRRRGGTRGDALKLLIFIAIGFWLPTPLPYEHVSKILAERGVEVDASCIWRWVKAYAPELNKRCRAAS
jgi:transposase, IS6 family